MILSIIKKHWLAVLLGVVVGLVTILPTILSIERLEKAEFKGIYPMLSDDEDHYLTLAKEIYDGHISLGNAYLQEGKEMPYTQPPLGAAYYALFAKIFHISVPTAGVINDFLLPIFSVLLLYSLLWLLTQSKKISLSFSALFFIFFLSSFNRPVNPQVSFILLLAGLYFVFLIVWDKYELKKVRKYNLFLSIIFGVLVYIYPFYWMTIVVLYTLLTLSQAFIEKDFKYCFQNWLYFFIPAFILSIPYLWNIKKLIQSPFFNEVNLRSGFINTHIPGSYVDVAIMLACLPLVYLVGKLIPEGKSWYERKNVFIGYSLILTGIILNWQNVITGKTIQFPQHLYPLAVLSLCIITAMSFIFIDIKKIGKYSLSLLIFSFILLCSVFYEQKNASLQAFKIIYSPKDSSSLQKHSLVIDWLNKNTPKDSVIYALGKDYNWVIPIYTDDNLYFNTNAGLSLISDVELENRWVILHFFDPIDFNYIQNNEREIWTNKFIEKYQSLESRRKILELITGKTYPKTAMMDEIYVERVLNTYKNFYKIGFEKTLKIYTVDYIIVDESQFAKHSQAFKSYNFLNFLIKIGDISIYKVN